jgi:hypothetical protein
MTVGPTSVTRRAFVASATCSYGGGGTWPTLASTKLSPCRLKKRKKTGVLLSFVEKIIRIERKKTGVLLSFVEIIIRKENK